MAAAHGTPMEESQVGAPGSRKVLEKVKTLTSEILSIPLETIESTSTFVRLGGDSFKAVSLFRRSIAVGIHLPFNRILNSTLDQLAEIACADAAAHKHGADTPNRVAIDARFPLLTGDYDLERALSELQQRGIRSDDLEDIYPCSPMQEGMYIGQSLGGTRLYQTSGLFELKGDYGLQDIRRVWQRIIDRHQSLRTVFIEAADHGSGRLLVAAVLKHTPARVSLQPCSDEDDARRIVSDNAWGGSSDAEIYHKITLLADGDSPRSRKWIQMDISHITVDGGSLIILVDELQKGLQGLSLSATAPGYDKYIKYLQTEVDEAENLDYWVDYLQDAPPCYFPKLSPTDGDYGSFMTVAVPQISIADLRSFSQTHGTTISGAMQAAWTLLLHTYSGLSSISFGYLSSGRALPVQGATEIVGPMMNLLVCRVEGVEKQSLGSILDGIFEDFTLALNHQCFALRDVQRILGTSETKLFNTIMTSYYSPSSVLDPESEGPMRLLASKNASDFDLVLKVSYTDHKIAIRLAYSSKLLSPEMAKNVAQTFSGILTQMAATEDAATPTIHFCGPSMEDRRQVNLWNERTLNDKLAQTGSQTFYVHRLIEHQAQIRPHCPAIDSWDGQMTYKSLDEHANFLAHQLAQLTGPSQFVALCFEKSKWYSIGLLGVLKSGNAFVPLDLSNPDARMRSILSAVGISESSGVIVCSRGQADRCSSMAQHIVILEDGYGFEQRPPPDKQSSPNDPAYVIFTSGSTGQPKGVVIEHGQYSFAARAHRKEIRIDENSRVLQFASYGFDTSMEDHLTTLASGACLCVPSEDHRHNLHELGRFATRTNANWAHLTPSLAESLTPEIAPTLKTMVLGGEAMTIKNVRNWARPPDNRLIQVYGPSECCVTSTISDEVHPRGDPSDIGTAFSGCATWIARPGHPDVLCAIGAVGELLMEGPILARGYINHNSSVAFVSGLVWAPEKRLYRTGDLVRYDEQGHLHFVGRREGHAVKIRGQRIEPGEVEKHIITEPLVQHALILAATSGPAANKLAAIVSLAGAQDSGTEVVLATGLWSPHIHRMKEFLLDALPAYMVPELWIILEYIPTNSSLKLDRKKMMQYLEGIDKDGFCELTVRMEDQGGLSQQREPTDMEKQMRRIWCDVLNCPENTSLDASFFSLGGDSISAMTVSSMARDSGIHVTAADVLRGRTIARIAAAASASSAPSPVLQQADETEHFGLSPIQRLHFLTSGDKGDPLDQQTMVVRLTAPVDQRKLESGLTDIVRRHPMLRARFLKDETGHWVQKISPAADSRRSIRLRFHSRADQDYVLEVVSDARRALDISGGPLIAADLFEAPECLLSATIHHLAVDTVSWRIILRELEDSVSCGTAAKSEQTTFQTWSTLQADFAADLKVSNLAPSYSLDDFSSTSGMYEQPNTLGDSVMERVSLDSELSSRLLASTGENHCMTEVLATCIIKSFKQVFQRLPRLFLEGHGREMFRPDLDVSNTVGWFTTFSPVVITDQDVSGLSLAQLLTRVQEVKREAPLNGFSYFSTLLHGYTPSMEVTLNYLGSFQQVETVKSLFRRCDDALQSKLSDLRRSQRATSSRYSLISILVSQKDGAFEIEVEWNKHMRHQDMIRDWIKSLRDSLEQLDVNFCYINVPFTIGLDYSSAAKVVQSLEHDFLIPPDNIEAIYPCSPIQTGLLLAQLRDPSNVYSQRFVVEAESTYGQAVSPSRLADAWRAVARTNPILRTVFCESPNPTTASEPFFQVVLKSIDPDIESISIRSRDIKDVLFRYGEEASMEDLGPLHGKALHKLRIFHTEDGSVYCVLNKNHLLTDGATSRLIFSDTSAAYDGRLRVDRTPYSDYIKFVHDQDRLKTEEYWKKYLDGVVGCHFPRLHTPSADGNRGFLRVESSIEKQILSETCLEFEITSPIVFQAAWALCLRTYLNADDVVFGLLTSGRDLPLRGAQEILGPMANMLLVRSQLSGDMKIRDVCQKLQSDNIEHLAHQTASLATIQHGSGRGAKGLINTIVNVQKRPVAIDETCRGIKWDLLSATDTSEYDVAVCAAEAGDDFDVTIEVPSSFMTDEQARGLMNAFMDAVGHICRRPVARVDDIGLSTPVDTRRLLDWHRRCKLEQQNECIHDLILETVYRQPSQQAISSWDGSLTYLQLGTLSTGLVKSLLLLRVGPGDTVVLCFEKSLWAVVSMLAVLRTGAAFVHIDPHGPRRRTEEIVRQTRAQVGLATRSQRDKLNGIVAVLEVDGPKNDDDPLWLPEPVDSDPSQPAYIIFTSGTTGTPKGVVISHCAFASAAFHNREWLQIKRESRVLQFTSYCFDACLEEILTVLMTGGTICIPSEEERMSDISGFIARHGVNWAAFTPSFLRTMNPEDLEGKVEFITVHAEAMSQALVDRWAGRIHMRPSYGPTECSVTSTVGARFLPGSPSNNIGFPVGCRAWVVNPRNHELLVPIGAVGELLLDGPIVGSGYLNDPDKTAASFVSPPGWARDRYCRHKGCFCRRSSRRLYKTGDLVRFAEDGSLLFLGRKDSSQVKVRGQRVELRDIQHHIDSAAQVGHGVVLMPRSGLLRGRIVAVISLADAHLPAYKSGLLSIPREEGHGGEIGEEVRALREHMEQQLPQYMIPETWLVVEGLPVQVSQKIDRKAVETWVEKIDQKCLDSALGLLRIREEDRPEAEEACGSLLEKIRVIWGAVLGLDPVHISTTQPFFNVGGDSIYAIQVMRACRQEGIAISTQDVLRNATISDLARIAARKTEEIPQDMDTESSESPHKSSFFPLDEGYGAEDGFELAMDCTPLQEHMFNTFHSKQYAPYLFNSLVQLREVQRETAGQLTTDLLMRVWQHIVDRHPILRTVFLRQNSTGGVYQAVLKTHVADALTVTVDSEEQAKAQSKAHVREMRSIMFKVALPPHSVRLLVDPEGRIFLHLLMFHGLIDHVSMGRIFAEWAQLYESMLLGSPLGGQAAVLGFDKYVGGISSRSRTRANDFWTSALRGVGPSIVADDSPKVECSIYDLGFVEFSVPITTQTREFCRAAGVTLSTLLQFSWSMLLHRHTGQETVCFGHLSSHRDVDSALADGVVGPMLSLMVGHASLASESFVVETMREMQRHNVAGLAHRCYDIGEVMARLGCGEEGLFNTLVNYRKVKHDGKEINAARSIWTEDPHEQHMVLGFNEGESGRLEGKLSYYAAMFTRVMVQSMVDEYCAVVQQLVSMPAAYTVDQVRQVLGWV